MTTANTSHSNPIHEAMELVSGMTVALKAYDLQADDREAIAASTFAENGAGDRNGYLAWVATYKRLVKGCAQLQRDLKAAARQGDEYAQSRRESNRHIITRLILLRRISKVAARINRERQMAEDAA